MTDFGKQDTEKPVNFQDKGYWYLLIVPSETTELRDAKNIKTKKINTKKLVDCQNPYTCFSDIQWEYIFAVIGPSSKEKRQLVWYCLPSLRHFKTSWWVALLRLLIVTHYCECL